MALDLILRNARIGGGEAATVDIAVAGGRIVDIASGIAADAPAEDINGNWSSAGFVETHITSTSLHLDRCQSREERLRSDCRGGRGQARVQRTDIYRAHRAHWNGDPAGTMRMRTHVEVDPRIGLQGVQRHPAAQQDYAGRSPSKSVFPQEGLLNDPGTRASHRGCNRVRISSAAVPITDSDPHGQIARISRWRGNSTAISIFISISTSIRRG